MKRITPTQVRTAGLAVLSAIFLLSGCTSRLRLPLNRPALEPFDRWRQPASASETVRVWFLGASSIVFDDRRTTLLSDGFFSRPRLLRVIFTGIAPNPSRIEFALDSLRIDRIDAVFVVHSHYDHSLDAPLVAEITHAEIIGSESTRNVWLGQASRAPFRLVQERETVRYGDFALTFVEAVHSNPDRAPGMIEAPLVPPRHVSNWKTGTVFSVLLSHPTGRILLHPSANYIPGALRDIGADVVYLGVIGLGESSPEFIQRYWTETVEVTCARRVILIHWDDIMRPLSEPLVAMPYFGGSATDAISQLIEIGRQRGVEVLLPTAFEETDPFANLPERPCT